MASPLLRLTLSRNPNPRNVVLLHPARFIKQICPLRGGLRGPGGAAGGSVESLRLIRAKAVEIGAPEGAIQHQDSRYSTILLEVGGMMCGACVSRVKSILSADDRIESVVVNMVTETAALKLKLVVDEEGVERVTEELAGRLVDCGFTAKRRRLGQGVGENVRKWKEMAEKKEVLLARSRNRVFFAWTLVALCCGSHASHLLHSLGIHVAHGAFWDLLHESYLKCGIAAASLLGPGRDLLLDGIKAFRKGSPNMNSLVGFGSIAAFLISYVSLLNPGLEWDSFFDEPVMLLGFVLLGRSLEERARLQASSDMNELLSLVATKSRLVITSSEEPTSPDSLSCASSVSVEIPTDDVRIGDSLLVLPGETIPVDGIVLAGRSVVDESMLTGESLLVLKDQGSHISAGTVNWDGPLWIEASTTGAMSTISKIIRMVEEAQAQEAPVQRLVDSIAGPFVYSVMTMSAATFAFWYYIGTNIFPDVLLNDIAGPEGHSLLLSLKLAVDVLVVSCPCALGLATPTAILVGTSLGAKRGLLIRGGDVLECLAGVNIVAFDKTGTLTEGKPAITAIASLLYNETEILRLAAAVEKTACHPIATAILNKAEVLKVEVPSTSGQLTEPGFGSVAELDGSLVAVGKMDWVHERFQSKIATHDLIDLEKRLGRISSNRIPSLNQPSSVVYVGREGEGIIGAIAISDSLRPDASSTVKRLQEKGIKTVLLSGDREEAVSAVGRMVGIESFRASVTPQQKYDFISSLQAEGKHVAMVGDGINDAPSLALADVGVALPIDSKENAASDAASVILLGNRLSQIVEAVDLARATISKVHQNLAWAVAYNLVAIPIAAGILLPQFDFAMTPSLSGGLMALSSIFVVTNSLLLRLQLNVGKRELR
ncbi:copper-transporting ATPase PAA2, chloroplastic [Phalaenopsis equestris]|uniref:copper-transporting ATPase PAA2, chloroplastic n=1 Tax=Phalaenopsis equestris TaxID=78828 RepID=UPI0009E1FED6|nr:copper-transporting ATPase PAA2, chloroplastic [Phalaenopsis equestris]